MPRPNIRSAWTAANNRCSSPSTTPAITSPKRPGRSVSCTAGASCCAPTASCRRRWRRGRGVALLPTLVARTLGGLDPVPFDETPPSRELWLLMRPDVSRLARVRAVADHLVELFHEHHD